MDSSVKLLTLNCWGLKYLSKFREERLQAIGNQISEAQHDIVALQEVWVEKDWQYISTVCERAYPYRRRFRAGVIAGPGLCILLKYPIESTFLYRFPINGRPSAFFRGDWYVGKSIAVTIIDTGLPNASKLAVLNSHMHAPYSLTGDAAYLTHRTCQAWDMAKFHSLLRQGGYAVIQVGDLNSEPESLPYRIFTQEGGLVDSWDALYGSNMTTNELIALMPPLEQIEIGGITCDSQHNTWRANRELHEAKRLDFALFDQAKLQPVQAKVVFTEMLPAPYSCSYSDHFGYSVEFKFNTIEKEAERPPAPIDLYADIIQELDTYQATTIPFQFTWRALYFFISLALVVGIQVGIGFTTGQPAWISVVCSIVGLLLAISGTINGLMCIISIPSEKSGLDEVKLEVLDALQAKRASKNKWNHTE
ncbi:hypothetical protein PUMCH_003579 [Australozyma saopauloensis]|uniref:Endonuclease/exonuclease/phosphatase domain-containing protein n=1 Tax=Australozyma saopauloensis TaxID=291208 RepID=A0AAX4HCK4_9ASCO|nr:hypothetical protein PUMCH_003579 [[Candida] saopauloensis]